MSQAENNKLIAEFMNYADLGTEGDFSYLKYHTSWDWLMPVVEKCRLESRCEYDTDDAWDKIQWALEEVNKEEIYKAVVEFINQYNKSKEEKWYELAVSYIHDNGTETIERKPSLDEAIDFAQKFKPALDVDFVFIDRWFVDYKGNTSGKDDEFKTLIINRK